MNVYAHLGSEFGYCTHRHYGGVGCQSHSSSISPASYPSIHTPQSPWSPFIGDGIPGERDPARNHGGGEVHPVHRPRAPCVYPTLNRHFSRGASWTVFQG